MIRRKMAQETMRDTWKVTSALLRYPAEPLFAALPAIREATLGANIPEGEAIVELIDRWSERQPSELQAEYVQTFDLGKRAALHVSWHQYGDRRQRGMVLLKLKRRYQQFDMTPIEDELPDWLPLMLEFAAEAPAPEGVSLLQEWRAAIELIRRDLTEQGSDWAVLLDAISATLPKLGADVRTAVEKLIAEGPPGDEVGLEPFGPDNDVPSGWSPAAPHYEPEQTACAGGTPQ